MPGTTLGALITILRAFTAKGRVMRLTDQAKKKRNKIFKQIQPTPHWASTDMQDTG